MTAADEGSLPPWAGVYLMVVITIGLATVFGCIGCPRWLWKVGVVALASGVPVALIGYLTHN
jgi:hypothetical protein